VSAIAARLAVDASAASVWCEERLPLNETIELSVTERIFSGDLDAIHDLIREAIDALEPLADLAGSLLCDEPEVLKRLSEVRLRQSRTGKAWHGGAITSAAKQQDAGVTDHAGKEPSGAGHQQEQPRRAKAGKAGTRGAE
jgi:hypothetical protein